MADQTPAVAATGDSERTLVIERTFRASPERVFKAFTDPAILVTWWGPVGFPTPECKLGLRAGGVWRTVMRAPDGSPHSVSGVSREIVPPKRLVLTWAWEEDDGRRGDETEVELTFVAAGNATHLRIVHR